MGRNKFNPITYTHRIGKPMVGWWMGVKECHCVKLDCNRPGGAACQRRAKRVINKREH